MNRNKKHGFWSFDKTENIQIIFLLIWYSLKNEGLVNLFRKQIFRNHLATPVEMDLSNSLTYKDVLPDAQHHFIELDLNAIRSNKVDFAVAVRGVNALRKLKKGFRYFAIVKENTVVGDIFCVTPRNTEDVIVHHDLEMLGIRCNPGEAYSFDLLVAPSYAGKHLSASIFCSLHIRLREEGFTKLYGYHWDDNIPAARAHRRINYRELPKRRVSRFFSFLWSKNL